jgi:hypothetical protein
MKVPEDEGVANHIGPESCADVRKDIREALTGGKAGRVLSRERRSGSGRRRRRLVRKATQDTSLRQEVSWPRVVEDPAHVWKLFAREPGDPLFALGRWNQGTRCEPRGETTVMNEPGKSDRTLDTEEASEQDPERIRMAEEVEGRGQTKGKTFHHNKLRTQDRERSWYGRP